MDYGEVQSLLSCEIDHRRPMFVRNSSFQPRSDSRDEIRIGQRGDRRQACFGRSEE